MSMLMTLTLVDLVAPVCVPGLSPDHPSHIQWFCRTRIALDDEMPILFLNVSKTLWVIQTIETSFTHIAQVNNILDDVCADSSFAHKVFHFSEVLGNQWLGNIQETTI